MQRIQYVTCVDPRMMLFQILTQFFHCSHFLGFQKAPHVQTSAILAMKEKSNLRCVRSFNPEQGYLINAVVQTLSISSSNDLCFLSFIAGCHRLTFLELLSLPWRTDESAIPRENNLIGSANLPLSSFTYYIIAIYSPIVRRYHLVFVPNLFDVLCGIKFL